MLASKQVWVAVCCLAVDVIGMAVEWPEPFLEDAALNDVCFIDARTGWAVGCRGVVLRTTDGGTTWERQSLLGDATFEAVHFVDKQRGWIVGGRSVPYTKFTQSVLFATRDGGVTWKRMHADLLPWLTDVHFVNAAQGYVCGRRSVLHTTSVFTTKDGGETWNAVHGRQQGGIELLDFQGNGLHLGLSSEGELLRMHRGTVEKTNSPPFRARSLAVAMGPESSSRTVIAGGDDGTIGFFDETTNRWSIVVHSAGKVAIRDLATSGQIVWGGGSPGNVILRSSDEGRHWHAFSLEQQIPLNKLCFVDGRNGWAVGELGTVLYTHDGGRTWQTQRGGSQKQAAVLFLSTDPSAAPWEEIAELAAVEGFRLVVCNLQPSTGVTEADDRVIRAAAVAAGADVGCAFEMSSAVIDLANALRIWRPDAVLMHAPIANEKTRQVVLSAVELANQQSRPLRLPPHRVARVAEFVANSDRKTEQVVIGMNRTTFELATAARSFFDEQHFDPIGMSLRLLDGGADSTTIVPKAKNLITGTYQQRGKSARRLAAQISSINQPSHSTVMFRRNIRSIAALGSESIGRVSQLLNSLQPDDRADLAFELACAAERRGDYATAQELGRRIIADSPGHPVASAASLMVLRLQTSEEVECIRRSQGKVTGIAVTSSSELPLAQQRSTANSPSSRSFAQSGNLDPESIDPLSDLQEIWPVVSFSPEFRFPVAAWQRRQGRLEEALRFYRSQVGQANDFRWRSIASSEVGLLDGNAPILKPVLNCPPVTEKPRLDGRLDELIWQECESVSLGDESPRNVAVTVRFARDAEFLFFAARIEASKRLDSDSVVGERKRDFLLPDAEQIRFCIDCDRDYQTHWEVSVDRRGNAKDHLNGNTTWDPEWYLATRNEQDYWTIEAAFPLRELTLHPDRLQVWAALVEYEDPREALKITWPSNAGSGDPAGEDFGWLQFGAAGR